ncbi:MAG: hypothetical protein AB1502_12390 [Thermodesulfobacteriota bacterium]
MSTSRPEFIFIAVVGFLIGLFILIGRISGWATLARFYRYSNSFIGECWRFQSAEMRWKVGYNNCLTIGANESGLYLSVFFLFRFGHPLLFIRWADISMNIKKGLLRSYLEFRFQQAPMIPFRVNERLGQQIAKAAGNAWPGEREKNSILNILERRKK